MPPAIAYPVPPAIIFFGTEDRLLATGREYVGRAKQLGLIAQLYVAKGEDHAFFNPSPWRERTLYLADQFLARHGYTDGPPTIAPSEDATMALAAESRQKN